MGGDIRPHTHLSAPPPAARCAVRDVPATLNIHLDKCASCNLRRTILVMWAKVRAITQFSISQSDRQTDSRVWDRERSPSTRQERGRDRDRQGGRMSETERQAQREGETARDRQRVEQSAIPALAERERETERERKADIQKQT